MLGGVLMMLETDARCAKRDNIHMRFGNDDDPLNFFSRGLRIGVATGVFPFLVTAWSFSASAQTTPSTAASQLSPIVIQENRASRPKANRPKRAAAAPQSKRALLPQAAAPTPRATPTPRDKSADANVRQLQAIDGSAADGYRPSIVSDLGPLGSQKLLTTPFSVSVMSKDLLQNAQVMSTNDLFRLHPFIFNMWPTTRGNPLAAMVRGFTTSTMLDNMRADNASIVDMEGVERVEVLSGLSGFLYGASDPGGIINYVLKSPTRTPIANIKGGLVGESGYVHADVGGPIAPGAETFARFNLARQAGGTSVDHQRIERTYVSGAVDSKILDDVLLQFKVFHSDYLAKGADTFWNVPGTTTLYPSAPDPRKLYGEPWGYMYNRYDGGNVKLTWDINDTFKARTAYTYMVGSGDSISINNTIPNNSGIYTQAAVVNAPGGTLTTQAGYAALDARFSMGPVQHTATIGYSASHYESKQPLDWFAFVSLPGSFQIANPTYLPSAPVVNLGIRPEPASTYFTWKRQNIFVGDTMDFGQHWSVVAGVNYASVAADTYDFVPPPGQLRTLQSRYDKSEPTPTVAITFKPTPWASIYGMYIEGLEQGGTAPAGTVNAGTMLAPYVSEQKEIGAKVQVSGVLLTIAAFDITKAYAYTDPNDNVYKTAGNENHKGVEISATGKVLPNLSIFGGVTFLDAKVVDDPVLAGKRPVNVPDTMLKLYAEYAPSFVPGLTVTGGIQYADKFAAFTDNRQYLPSVTTFDVGFRYETLVEKTPVITRFNVTNVTNEAYWMSTRFIGPARTFMLTLEAKL
jgi:iron complex outermembrane receptor protein